MQWSTKVYRMVFIWLGQISNNRKLHYQESIDLSSLSSKYTYFAIYMSGIAAAASFFNVWDKVKWLQITLTIISGITASAIIVTQAIVATENFEKKSEKHRQVASMYDDLSNLIQGTMLKSTKPDPDTFLSRVMDQFHFIAQLVPQSIPGESSTAELPNLILMQGAQSKNNNISAFIRAEDKKIFDKDSPSPDLQEVITEEEEAEEDEEKTQGDAIYEIALERTLANFNRKVTPVKTPMRGNTFFHLRKDRRQSQVGEEIMKKNKPITGDNLL